MRLVHGLVLLSPHHERFVVCPGRCLAFSQFSKDGFHVFDRTPHPLKFGVLKPLSCERGAHVVIGEYGAVISLGGLVNLDPVVLDGRSLDLLGNTALHVARSLPDL